MKNPTMEKAGIRGLITVTQVDPVTGKVLNKKTVENMITKQGLAMMLYGFTRHYWGEYLGNSTMFGQHFANSGVGNGRTSTTDWMISYNIGPTLFALDSETMPNADLKDLPFMNAKGEVNDSELTFYATGKTYTPDSKEGTIIHLERSSYVATELMAGRSFYIPAAKGNGTFNKIAFGINYMNTPVRPVYQTPFFGKVLPYNTNTTEVYYARPGIPGLTSEDEILLAYGIQNARYVYNLETGVFSILDSSDPRYGVLLGSVGMEQYIINNKWVRITRRFNSSYDVFFVRDLTTNAETTYSFGTNPGTIRNIILYNDKLYLSGNYSSTLMAFNKSTFARESASDLSISTLLTGFPSQFTSNVNSVYFGMRGENYTAICDTYGTIFEFTDMTNAWNTVVERHFAPSLGYIQSSNNEYFFCENVSVPQAYGSVSVTNYTSPGLNNLYSPILVSLGSGPLLSYADLGQDFVHTSGTDTYVSYAFTVGSGQAVIETTPL